MDDTPPPDNFEKGIRFGCGFLFGAVLAFFLVLRTFTAITNTGWPPVLATAFASGLLAMRYGDAFWRLLSKCCEWFRWWHWISSFCLFARSPIWSS